MPDRRQWNSTLAAPTKPIARHTRLHNRGGSMFKLTADDKAQWKWFGEYVKRPHRCDGCAHYTYLSRCHLLAKGKGGRVIDNIALLCEGEIVGTDLGPLAIPGCHELQEKRTERFEAETGVDLYAKARAHTAQWRKETGRG